MAQMTSLSDLHARPSAPEAEPVRVLRDDGSLDPAVDPGLTLPELETLYRAMRRSRLLDDRLTAVQRQGRIGFHIGSHGEEAAIIGSAFALRPQDWLFPCYREFGAALLRGFPLARYVDQMFGDARDPMKGRQMPDHYACREAHVASISSPIGTQITQAVGFAWAAKLKHDPLAVLVYFGDGATSSAEFHNGMNFAGVFKVPVILLCRNNGWAISVPAERQTASEGFAVKAQAYGMPGVRVDGNDVLAVVKVTRDALARALGGGGPTLLEAVTYRIAGHSTSDDPKVYRREEALEPWRQRDPIQRLRGHLQEVAGWTDARDQALEAELDAEIRAAVAASEKVGPPALDTLFDDVYAELPWHLREQREALRSGPRPKGPRG